MPDQSELPHPSGEQTLQVGRWTVEPALHQLSAEGKSVKLEPKAMALLVYLAQRPGQVVGREALLSAIWPGVVVGDDSLTQVVIKLRKALGEDAAHSAYIQTIPKGGYRLVAPASEGAQRGSAPVVLDSAERAGKRRWPPLWVASVAIAAALLVAVSIAWIAGQTVTSGAPGRAAAEGSETTAASRSAITVRPFETLGDDPQAKLLAAGLTEDLITDLSKVLDLSVVIAPFGQPIGSTPGEAPSVRYVVTGSVQSAAERLRLHVRLTDAETGQQLWSERFDHPLNDYFALQEELGPRIIAMLPAKVSEAELQRVSRRHTRNLEAYEEFQRGQAALLSRQQTGNAAARESFRRAIRLDAGFARAYAGLALTHAADYRNQWTDDGHAALDRAFGLARTAYEINPDIAESYWVLAFVHMERRQHEKALTYLNTLIGLYPSFADGYALMGGVNTYLGRPAATVPLLRTAMRLNPQAGYLYFLLLGRAYLFMDDLEQAKVNLEHALSRNPESVEAHVYLAAVHVLARDQTAALWQAEEIRARQPHFSIRDWLATYPMTDATQNAVLAEAMAQLAF